MLNFFVNVPQCRFCKTEISCRKCFFYGFFLLLEIVVLHEFQQQQSDKQHLLKSFPFQAFALILFYIIIHLFKFDYEQQARVCVCVCVCVFTSIHREGFICLDQLGYQGADKRCYIEDVNFLCQTLSSQLQNATSNISNQPLYPARTLEADKTTT